MRATVVARRVTRRARDDFVDPSTPWDKPRSMVNTRPSTSPRRSTANSPRRAPESAASRTNNKSCSALNNERSRRGDAGSPTRKASVQDRQVGRWQRGPVGDDPAKERRRPGPLEPVQDREGGTGTPRCPRKLTGFGDRSEE